MALECVVQELEELPNGIVTRMAIVTLFSSICISIFYYLEA